MSGRVLAIVLGGAVVLAAVGGLLMFGQRATQAPPTTDTAPPAAATTPAPTSKPAATKPAGASTAKPATADATPTPEAAPTLGTLIIESDVPETSVFIDRVYLGNAPVTAKNLTPGAHHLNMSVTGYEGVSETIDVEPGTRTISMKFKEIKLDEKIDVSHKHAIGSCSGALRASPQRLQYETTNAGDAFVVALTNLDTFEVDYLQKNLRIKVRDGKTYNFTDFEGNVDRLYRFHEAVQKVRQRLLSGKRP